MNRHETQKMPKQYTLRITELFPINEHDDVSILHEGERFCAILHHILSVMEIITGVNNNAVM